jgi:hypothetical protein
MRSRFKVVGRVFLKKVYCRKHHKAIMVASSSQFSPSRIKMMISVLFLCLFYCLLLRINVLIRFFI